MAGKATAGRYVVNCPFSRTDSATGLDTRFETGDYYDGPDIETYLKRGLIVPAPAGSSQPGSEEGKSE